MNIHTPHISHLRAAQLWLRRVVAVAGCIIVVVLLNCSLSCTEHSNEPLADAEAQSQKTTSFTVPRNKQSSEGVASDGKQGAVDAVTYKNQYINYAYGYSIKIPEKLMGTKAGPPAPDHGVSIALSEQPEARIWTDGSFNSLFWSTLDEAADARVEGSKDEASQVEVMGHSTTRLHNLPATRITLRRKDQGSSEVVIEDVVLALKNTKNEVGLVYSIGLITTESRYSQDKEVFDQVVQSWRTRQPLE